MSAVELRILLPYLLLVSLSPHVVFGFLIPFRVAQSSLFLLLTGA
jgi:hypothetical protein